jgi:hypothetical protein
MILEISALQQTQLPSGPNVTVVTTIANQYGAASQYANPSINVTASNPSEQTLLVYETYNSVLNISSVNETTYYYALLVTAGEGKMTK